MKNNPKFLLSLALQIRKNIITDPCCSSIKTVPDYET